MSLLLKKGGPLKGEKKETGAVKEVKTVYIGKRSMKFVELTGNLAALNAGLSSKIINYTLPDGYGAELIAVGIMPDWNVGAGASRLLDTEIGYDDKLTGIKFLTNHAGMNFLPYGDRLSKQPIRYLDVPMRKGSLTPKFNEGMKVQVVVTAGAVAIADTVRARALILIYEEADARAIFGVGISELATIIGGVEQSKPEIIFADYARLDPASAGTGQWQDLYTKDVKDYEAITLSHMGILPHANSLSLKLHDLRYKKEFPEYEPYWTVAEAYNSLPFGDDDDYQGPAELPDVVKAWEYSNTTMSVKQRDNNAVIPQYGMAIQLLGRYRRLK